MTYNPKIHNRRSIRLKKYDYSRAGIYFVTICVQDRVHLFGEIEHGEMKLNSFGKIVAEEWEKSDSIRENITMGDYIIMPDHFHGIIQINKQIKTVSSPSPGEFKSPSHSIGAIIRGIKGATTKTIKSILFSSWSGELQFTPDEIKLLKTMDPNKSIWQRNYHEDIIWDQRHLENVVNYIKNNPKKWKIPQ